MSTGAASVVQLHRYPVKSVLGEQLTELAVDERGVAGDRRWAVRTAQGKIGSGKTTRRFAALPGLQQLRARDTADGVVVELPDGTVHPVGSAVLQERLSALLGEPVTLAPETDVSHFDDGPVSLVARASVEAVAAERGEPVETARFRPNLVLDGVGAFADEEWVGRTLRVGTVVLAVELASPRCVMVDSETADLPAQPGNLKAVGRLNDACLGVVARVVQPGVVRVGDRVVVA